MRKFNQLVLEMLNLSRAAHLLDNTQFERANEY